MTSRFGAYELRWWANIAALEIVADNGASVFLQGDDAALCLAEYDDALRDIANGGQTRWARTGERDAAQEIFGVYFN